MEIAAALGSDVPSQLAPGLALGTGAGDVVEPLRALAPHAFAIVPLPHGCRPPPCTPRPIGWGSVARSMSCGHSGPGWRGSLGVNDLEAASRSLCPAIDDALAELRRAGAEQAFVCGSGPTCAGIWWGEEASDRAGAAANSLAPQFPGATAVVPVTGIGHNSAIRMSNTATTYLSERASAYLGSPRSARL